MLVVFHQKQPTVIKQSSVVIYLMQSVTSTMLLILFCNWLHITVRFILGYVVRRLDDNRKIKANSIMLSVANRNKLKQNMLS